MSRATAHAHPNIALVKYWGKRDLALNLPAVPSLSLTLARFETETTVTWGTTEDRFLFNGEAADPTTAAKIAQFLSLVDPARPPCNVDTANNFPSAAGLASSSSGFAALALAAVAASGQEWSKEQLSVLARRGSGSACRSLWGGFVEWKLGKRADGADSCGTPIAPSQWDVRMVVGVVSSKKKPTPSSAGMESTRLTSPYFPAWVETAAADVELGRKAVLDRDLAALGEVMESSTLKMHATMWTGRPTLNYWLPGTLGCLDAVQALRKAGIGAWATMDAGPNVKVLCLPEDSERVAIALAPWVERTDILAPGGDATVEQH